MYRRARSTRARERERERAMLFICPSFYLSICPELHLLLSERKRGGRSRVLLPLARVVVLSPFSLLFSCFAPLLSLFLSRFELRYFLSLSTYRVRAYIYMYLQVCARARSLKRRLFHCVYIYTLNVSSFRRGLSAEPSFWPCLLFVRFSPS